MFRASLETWSRVHSPHASPCTFSWQWPEMLFSNSKQVWYISWVMVEGRIQGLLLIERSMLLAPWDKMSTACSCHKVQARANVPHIPALRKSGLYSLARHNVQTQIPRSTLNCTPWVLPAYFPLHWSTPFEERWDFVFSASSAFPSPTTHWIWECAGWSQCCTKISLWLQSWKQS